MEFLNLVLLRYIILEMWEPPHDCVTVMLKHTPGGSSVFGFVCFTGWLTVVMDRQIDILTLATVFSLAGGATVMEEDCK